MSLTDFGTIRNVIRSLLEKSNNLNLSKIEIDYQFSYILEKIAIYFSEEKYFFLFDWITETVKKEQELGKKLCYYIIQGDEKQREILQILIFKLNVVHAKIIESVVDEIYLSYMDYIDLKSINEIEVAIESKIRTLGLANSFILYLTENRYINEHLFDSYIELISQALNVFD